MTYYQTILNVLERPANIPQPPYPAPPWDMTLETALAKRELIDAFLPALPAEDDDFRTYLTDRADYELACIRARVRALEKQLHLPLQYRQEQDT